MIHVDAQEHVDRNWWDEKVRRTEYGTIYQTAHWAEFYQRYTDGKTWYLIASEDDEAVGLLSLSESILWPGPFAGGGSLAWLSPLAGRILTGLVWSHGPIVLRDDRRVEIISALLEGVDRLARKRGVLCANRVTTPLGYDDAAVISAFQDAGFSAMKWATYVVDLTPSEESLWKNLKGGGVARTPVRKARRQGVTVRLAQSREDLRRYYEIMREHARLNGLSRTQYARWALMAEQLGESMKIFLAEYNGRIIAGAGIVVYNGLMHLFRPVQSACCYVRKIYAGDLLQWSIVQWGQANGMKGYDLVGVNPEPGDAKERGIAGFKAKWGGRYIEYYEYTKIYKFGGYKLIYLIRQTLARILKIMGRQI